jgi:protein-tyrosine phosphatase
MIKRKKPVLVHCIAGGRSGTVLVSYLINQGRSYNDSISTVRELIEDIFVVDCPAQEEILKNFELYVRNKNNNGV